MALTRRKFIQIGGAAGGAAVATGARHALVGARRRPGRSIPRTDGERVVASYCELCFWGCGVLAHVKDGRVTKITGNPAPPALARHALPARRGRDRPALRPRPAAQAARCGRKRGEDVFEEVSWDDAR